MADDFTGLPDLASRAFGGGIVFANDEFFEAADHLVLPEPPTFTPRTFGPKGQTYDGWETRRRRSPGFDQVIVRLGAPGVIRGVDVDTAFFTGNYPPYAQVDASGKPDFSEFTVIVPRSALKGDSHNLFPVTQNGRFAYVRLTIFPDGGVARLRVHGDVVPDPDLLPEIIDVAAVQHGARVTDCSNMFYGHPQKMLMPGLAQHMGDGWETARRRDDGNDWVTIRLAAPAAITHADLDTTHFKGNSPGWASLQARDESGEWFELLPRTALTPDTPHRFRVSADRLATDVRLDIFPDGGMARLRLHGRPSREYLEKNFRGGVENA